MGTSKGVSMSSTLRTTVGRIGGRGGFKVLFVPRNGCGVDGAVCVPATVHLVNCKGGHPRFVLTGGSPNFRRRMTSSGKGTGCVF